MVSQSLRPINLIVEDIGHSGDAPNRKGSEHLEGCRAEVEITQAAATGAAVHDCDSDSVSVRFEEKYRL